MLEFLSKLIQLISSNIESVKVFLTFLSFLVAVFGAWNVYITYVSNEKRASKTRLDGQFVSLLDKFSSSDPVVRANAIAILPIFSPESSVSKLYKKVYSDRQDFYNAINDNQPYVIESINLIAYTLLNHSFDKAITDFKNKKNKDCRLKSHYDCFVIPEDPSLLEIACSESLSRINQSITKKKIPVVRTNPICQFFGNILKLKFPIFASKKYISSINFYGRDLGGIYLKKANLTGINLCRANLECSNLENAILEDAFLDGLNLYGANVEWADFKNVQGKKAKFKEAVLDGINFEKAQLQLANFKQTKLKKARFFEANVEGADFSNAVLEEAMFYKTNLNKAKTLQGVNLDKVIIEKAVFDKLPLSIRDKYEYSVISERDILARDLPPEIEQKIIEFSRKDKFITLSKIEEMLEDISKQENLFDKILSFLKKPIFN